MARFLSQPAQILQTPTGARRFAKVQLWIAGGIAAVGSGCRGPQSGLDPAGRGAERIAELFWWMAGGTVVVWLLMIWLTVSAIRGRASRHTERSARLYIIGGGAVFPTVVLCGLLIYGLGMMPELLAPAPEGALKIKVTGEQWWWRVRYEPATGDPVVLANEIRLPVGQAVEFELDSPDVIHSFWIPALGGKMDMIPGRTTRLLLEPTRTGVFRGVCAEYCGMSHALMAFDVHVVEVAEFEEWLSEQRAEAAEPETSETIAGREHFFANGCSACHSIRGTEARSALGPDLTHVGSRGSIGAGIVVNDREGLMRWIARTKQVKPGVLMPEFGMLPARELEELAAYLESLR